MGSDTGVIRSFLGSWCQNRYSREGICDLLSPAGLSYFRLEIVDLVWQLVSGDIAARRVEGFAFSAEPSHDIIRPAQQRYLPDIGSLVFH